MTRKVLHLLSQRPSLTGSGVSLDSIVRCATAAGWEQRVVIGVPGDDPSPAVGGLRPEQMHPLVFGAGTLDFPVPGMSDVMPYPSSRFSRLSVSQLESYRRAWRAHVSRVVESFRPDLVHSRHVWLLSSLVKECAPDIPVVTHCHATGLRQLELCPHLREEVTRGCARNDGFFALHALQARKLVEMLRVDPERVHVVGEGYRPEIFHAEDRGDGCGLDIAYAGKLSRAKGLPYLLDAFEVLAEKIDGLTLHVAGSGGDAESEDLRQRMTAMAPRVVMYGHLGQDALAALLRRSRLFVLPSFYEGLPLVLIEALACGCRLVCTALDGVRHGLGAAIDPFTSWVVLPRLRGPDTPVEEDCPAFVEHLAGTMESALFQPLPSASPELVTRALEPFSWPGVFARIERVWRGLLERR